MAESIHTKFMVDVLHHYVTPHLADPNPQIFATYRYHVVVIVFSYRKKSRKSIFFPPLGKK